MTDHDPLDEQRAAQALLDAWKQYRLAATQLRAMFAGIPETFNVLDVQAGTVEAIPLVLPDPKRRVQP